MVRSGLIILFYLSFVLSLLTPLIFKWYNGVYAQDEMTLTLAADTQSHVETEFEEDGKILHNLSHLADSNAFPVFQDFNYTMINFQTYFSSILLPPPKHSV
jgi:hypothetical protein